MSTFCSAAAKLFTDKEHGKRAQGLQQFAILQFVTFSGSASRQLALLATGVSRAQAAKYVRISPEMLLHWVVALLARPAVFFLRSSQLRWPKIS